MLGCCHGLCVLVSPGVFDLFGDLIDGVAGVFEFEIDGFVVMSAMILQCLHEVFWKVGAVVSGIPVFFNLAELFEQEAVVVFGRDGVGLHEHGVDLFEFDGACLVADGFKECAQGEVSDAFEDAFGGLDDQVHGLVGEGGLGHAYDLELGEDGGLRVVGREGLELAGPGDAAVDVGVDRQLELVAQAGMADEDEVVVFWEVLQKQSYFTQRLDREVVGVVDDRCEHFACLVEAVSFVDELSFALVSRGPQRR